MLQLCKGIQPAKAFIKRICNKVQQLDFVPVQSRGHSKIKMIFFKKRSFVTINFHDKIPTVWDVLKRREAPLGSLMMPLLLAAFFASGKTPGICVVPPASQNGSFAVFESCTLTCEDPLTPCVYEFDTVDVKAGAELSFGESNSISIKVRRFLVAGSLIAGTENRPYLNKLNIIFTGKSRDQDDPTVAKTYVGHLPLSKFLIATASSKLSLHGKPKTPWIKLVSTAKAGSNKLVLENMPEGWGNGDKIVVPTTGLVTRNHHRNENEVVTVKAVTALENGAAVVHIQEKLKYEHYGNSPDIRLNGEVGILSRNIRLMGDNDDTQHDECTLALEAGFSDKAQLAQIRTLCYGGHTLFLRNASVQLSNLEFSRMGQATRIARYPLHWHLAADASAAHLSNYALNNSIHQTYQRCVS